MKYRILFLAAILACSTSHALTVRDALIGAYKNNQELLTTRQAVIASHEKIVQAKGGFRPKVDAKVSGSLSEGMTKSDSDSVHRYDKSKGRNGSVTATQNLFRGFADKAKVDQTEHEILSSWAQLKDKEQEIFLKVIQAYLNLYAKYATVEVLKANLATMQQNYESARTKRGIGEETITQESLAEAKYAEAQSKLENGLSELVAAKATFEQLTGIAAPERVDNPKELIDVPNSAIELQEIALRDNPKITQAVEALAAAKQGKKIYTGQLLPSLDLQASTSKDITEKKSTLQNTSIKPTTLGVNNQVGLTLTVPLYEQGVTRSQRRQASETIVQNRINIEKVKQELVRDCKQAYRAYMAAKTNMVSTGKQVKAQEVAVDGTTQELAVGTKIMFEVLQVQAQLLEAKLNLINAIQQYYLYLYQMFLLQGKLTAEGLDLPVEIFRPELNYNEVKNSF